MDKADIRKILLTQRAKAHGSEQEGHLAAQAAWLKEKIPNGSILAAYQPIRSERDPRPLLGELGVRSLAFPKVLGPEQALAFYAAEGLDDFKPGAFGVLEPLETLPLVWPQVTLVPLVGFDSVGYRLGYGGGFYDRTLAQLDSLNIGFAYDGQLSSIALNIEATDRALDFVMTPKRLYDFTGSSPKDAPWP